MTQFMKLLLAGTITGVVMMTAAIGTAAAAGSENRITILYDAFGKDPSMRKDWGFSALVEIAGERILFDTGDDRDIFAANVKAKNVDLTTLDFVVLSHRHSDHMAGLAHVLSVNPTCSSRTCHDNIHSARRAAECPLLAQSGHGLVHCKCPLSGVKRTWRLHCGMSANDPKRTSARDY